MTEPERKEIARLLDRVAALIREQSDRLANLLLELSEKLDPDSTR